MADNHQIEIDWGSAFQPVPDEARLRSWVRHALDRQGQPACIDIRIVDEDEMRELNRRYRGKDRPTNVLSFAADLHPDVPINLLGDLVICAPVVAEEARVQDKPLEDHWAHMVIHGVLHLLGHDHIDGQDAEIMESLEREILQEMGIDDPYQA